jgi:hypothetical protein
LGDCLLWAIFLNYKNSPKVSYFFTKVSILTHNPFGVIFGLFSRVSRRFFYNNIRSCCNYV